MNPLVSAFANGTVHVWEAATIAAAAFAVRTVGRKPQRPRSTTLDNRVLQDIGVEPGSITWIR